MSGLTVVVGSINADLLIRLDRHPSPGETLLGESMAVLPGGKGANQAVAAARLGAATALVGAVGNDAYADIALSGLRAAGVNLTGLVHPDGSTGVALVEVDRHGENTIVVIPGANGTMDRAAVESQRELIASAEIVLLQGEIPRDGIEAAAALATGRVLLNLAPVVELDPAVVRAADPLVVNEHEAELALSGLCGQPASTGHEDLVRGLLDAGVRSVVMTVGAAGALVGETTDHGGASVTVIPAPTVRAVDTTGAGDAFTGALAAALSRGEDLATAARFAARVGAFAVQAAGAQPSYPTLVDELPAVRQGIDPEEAEQR